jgi:NTP pyrophosphatase (non-canonical NTP hydrolase)
VLTLAHYQQRAETTDLTAQQGRRDLDFALLGLFGEVGSLLSELKKKQRDADSYIGYAPSVIEELGDVLWYFASLATRADISLAEIAHRLSPDLLVLAERPANEITFADLQPDLTATGPKPPEAFERTLIRVAGEVGALMTEFSSGRLTDTSQVLYGHMTAILRSLVVAANEAGVSLADAAHRNLIKTFDRWPPEKVYPPLFDEGFDPDERIPRRIEMYISEKNVAGKTYVLQKCNAINIGDRLTDNKLEEDDYRFHDVFHLAYAAILGWSPVLRGLFKVKRKSNPRIDEAEDGARAALIEEGVSTWIFNHTALLNFFENLKSVDYGLLKAVRQLVAGYEVERCPLWLWEEAILQGYNVFRQLRQHRCGLVIADLAHRSISFQADAA